MAVHAFQKEISPGRNVSPDEFLQHVCQQDNRDHNGILPNGIIKENTVPKRVHGSNLRFADS
jgi:hypothetical protein